MLCKSASKNPLSGSAVRSELQAQCEQADSARDFCALDSSLRHSRCNASRQAALVLATGEVFWGEAFGAVEASQGRFSSAAGELCFNVSQTGYQEILTDPSYAGQVLVFSAPHIGNTGINGVDWESERVWAQGVVLRERPVDDPTHRECKGVSLAEWLSEQGVMGVCGVDTRALVCRIRGHGAVGAAMGVLEEGVDSAELERHLLARAKSCGTLEGEELAVKVSTQKRSMQSRLVADNSTINLTVVDLGAKASMLKCLEREGFKLHVLRAVEALGHGALERMCRGPVFLSNGPGDPEETYKKLKKFLAKLLASKVPVLGVCLGHQLLARALGLKTYKLMYGHRGSNHPVQNLQTQKVEITAQNHGFAVKEAQGAEQNPVLTVTHRSLFDGSVEAFKCGSVWGVQYHPESAPGPHDSRQVFEDFYKQCMRYAAGGGE